MKCLPVVTEAALVIVELPVVLTAELTVVVAVLAELDASLVLPLAVEEELASVVRAGPVPVYSKGLL